MEKLNIRLSYGRDPKTEEVAILNETHYYPFGLSHNGYTGNHRVFEPIRGGRVNLIPVRNYLDDTYRYDFNAKEHQPELGLNWHDYHARNYDAALGRWMNVDPMGEKYPSWSPYNYVMNSPLRFTDPTGMFIEPPTKPGEIEGDVHFDEDTGASYEWDGEGGWHSDMQGVEELDEVVITNESSSGSGAGEASKSGMGVGAIDYYIGWESGFATNAYKRAAIATTLSAQLDGNTRVVNQMDGLSRSFKYSSNIAKAGPVVSGAMGIYNTTQGYHQDGGSFGYNAQRAALGSSLSIMAGSYGATYGASIGASIGVWFGGVGTVPGAIIGGVIGGIGGGMIGQSAGEVIIDKLHD